MMKTTLLSQQIHQNGTNKITLTLSLVYCPFYLTLITSLLFYLLFPLYYFAFLLYMLLNRINADYRIQFSISVKPLALLDITITIIITIMAVSVVLVVDPTKPHQGYAGRNVFASCAFIGCGYGRNLEGVTTMKIKKK